MSDQRDNALEPPPVGLIAAGGHATRIEPLPCSKELYPIGFRPVEDGSLRPKVVGHYLLEKMRHAGAETAYVVLRSGKWDIPAYFGDGALAQLHLAYLIMNRPFGTPYTLDQAFPFVQERLIVFGFPDMLFEPDDAFVRLRERQASSGADLVLGLFPAHRPETADMVDLDAQGRIRQIVIKPAVTKLRYTWIIALWTPAFTRFMHDYLAAIPVEEFQAAPGDTPRRRELFVGDVIQAAIEAGMRAETVLFADSSYVDIGTPDELVRASRLAHQEQPAPGDARG